MTCKRRLPTDSAQDLPLPQITEYGKGSKSSGSIIPLEEYLEEEEDFFVVVVVTVDKDESRRRFMVAVLLLLLLLLRALLELTMGCATAIFKTKRV